MREHKETFLEELRARTAHGLPRYAEEERSRFLRCGVLAHGFARVRCAECGHELLVGFSCKVRGICPSSTTRMAHDTAAHLTERVLPRVPYRQWGLTFPWRFRLLLARRPALVSLALLLFLRSLFAWQRRQARARGICGKPGAVTFVQRFSSALRLNIHFHVSSCRMAPSTAREPSALFPRPRMTTCAALLERTARFILEALEAELCEGADDIADSLTQLDTASPLPASSSRAVARGGGAASPLAH